MPKPDATWVGRDQLKDRKPERGFKAHAKRLGVALRQKHGWSEYDRIDCFELAAAMGIRVANLTSYRESEAVDQLVLHDPACFSAATIPTDDATTIVLNDSHNLERQASSLAHEIGHVFLAHEVLPWLSDTGCREFEVAVEIEAGYFGSVLLAPDEAVLKLARRGLTIPQAAKELGISTQMMRWRYNDSGAARRLGGRR